MLVFGASTPSMQSRWTSWGLVAALHVLLVLGLGAGLMRDALKPTPAPPQLDILKPPPELPPPEPQPLLRDADPKAPLLPPVPLPDHWEIVRDTPLISTRPLEPGPLEPLQPTRSLPLAPPADPLPQASAPRSAGMLCPTQVRPQTPATTQEGRAHLRVTGTVQGGRVVAVQMQSLQALPDRRAQRALLAEVERTLREGYACSQDGVFEQEFVFNIGD